jgi:hypothetical protein
MIELGSLGRTLWPAEVHRRWLEQASSAAADPSIPAADRLALTVDRVTALLDLGEEEGWRAAAAFPVDAPLTAGAGGTALEAPPKPPAPTAGAAGAASPADVPDEAVRVGAAEVARGCLNIGDAAMRWGQHVEARRRLVAALRLADRHHYPRLRELVLATLAHLDWFTGPWAGLGQRTDRLARSANLRTRLNALLVAGHLDAADGMHRSAAEKLETVLTQGCQLGTRWLAAEAAAALARLRLADGQVAAARALTDEPVSVITAKGIWLWATDLAPVRVEALAAVGRTGEAAKLTAAFARGLRGRSAPAPQAALATCQAILAERNGKPGQAAGLFAVAGDAWAALPRPYPAALARERCGYSLIRAGQREAGLAVLREVFGALCALPARGDARRVMDALRDHGADVWMPPRWLPDAGWWHANAAGSPGVRLLGGRARTWARGSQPPAAPVRAAARPGGAD